jgi:hypothetical protein
MMGEPPGKNLLGITDEDYANLEEVVVPRNKKRIQLSKSVLKQYSNMDTE